MTPARVEPTGLAATRAKDSGAGMSLDDVWVLAERTAASKLFAMRTPDEAFALMMLCQAEGLHPMTAVRRYHLIQGRPTMRSDAMQGELMARGWVVTPLARTATHAKARFSHRDRCPEGFEMEVTIQQFEAAGLTKKDIWRQYPDDMLWARLIGKATRTLDPGIIAGIMSSDEAEDVAWSESPQGRHSAAEAHVVQVVAAEDAKVPGQGPSPLDQRPYLKLAADACAATNADVRKLHAHLLTTAAALGRIDGPVPTKLSHGIKALADVYLMQRQWLRRELADWCEQNAGSAEPVHVEVEAVARGAEWEPGSDG